MSRQIGDLSLKKQRRLRRQGLRPVQIWVPDSRTPGFEAQCRCQVRRINRSVGDERDALDFIEAVR